MRGPHFYNRFTYKRNGCNEVLYCPHVLLYIVGWHALMPPLPLP